MRLATEVVLNAACDTVTPQGVVALVDIPPPYQYEKDNVSLSSSAADDNKKKSKLFLLFDGISDPGNVGTLLRSAKAVGAECVILLPEGCDS